MLEAALHHSGVESTEKDLLAVSLEPHLLHTALLPEVLELDPIVVALGVERGAGASFDVLDVFFLLPADYPAFAPLLGLVRVLVERQAVIW